MNFPNKFQMYVLNQYKPKTNFANSMIKMWRLTTLNEQKYLYDLDENHKTIWNAYRSVDQFGKLHENSICDSNRLC